LEKLFKLASASTLETIILEDIPTVSFMFMGTIGSGGAEFGLYIGIIARA
jgi:hypothetical protein